MSEQLLRIENLSAGYGEAVVLHDVNLALRFCSHGLLLLEDGGTRHGPLADILDSATLAMMYGCAMHEVRTDAGRLFFPD